MGRKSLLWRWLTYRHRLDPIKIKHELTLPRLDGVARCYLGILELAQNSNRRGYFTWVVEYDETHISFRLIGCCDWEVQYYTLLDLRIPDLSYCSCPIGSYGHRCAHLQALAPAVRVFGVLAKEVQS